MKRSTAVRLRFASVRPLRALFGCSLAVGFLACGRVGYDLVPTGSGGATNDAGGPGPDATGSGGSGAGGRLPVAGGGSVQVEAGAGGASGGDAATGPGGSDAGVTDSGCSVAACPPWWDATFSRRRLLSFDQSGESANVDGLPVLVRLDQTRIDYAVTATGGADLRFVDDDGRTVLPHDLERWDATGTSVVWVRVPRIDGATTTDHVWMYYGKTTAPDAQQRSAVWADFGAVYHLDGLAEASGKLGAATDHGSADATDGIGHARDFDGVAAYLDLGGNLPLLQGTSQVTLSLRVRVRSVVGERALISASVNATSPTGLSRAFMSFVNTADLRAGGRARDTDQTSSFLTTTLAPVAVGRAEWQHLAAVMDLATQEILLYVNGSAQTTDALSVPFSASVTDGTPTSFNNLGASDDSTSQFIDGTLDEVRIAPVRRSAAFLGTDARSEADQLVTYGPEESAP